MNSIRKISPANLLLAVIGGLAVVSLMVLGIRRTLRVSEEEIRERIVATIQSEAKASFLVTGSLDLTATTTIENSKTLLPGLLDIDLGTSRAMVQVPGRAYYGFDVRKLEQQRIRIHGDTVDMPVPQPQLLSVDTNLGELRVWTQKGWLRSAGSVDAVERSAIRRIDNTLARQAAAHIATATQPHMNTAEALQKMLRPVLAAAGLENPVFRFQIGERILLEPD